MHELNNQPTTKLVPINDSFLRGVKTQWFAQSQQTVTNEQFIALADKWFKSTRLNTLHNWDQFPNIDIIMGCTNFIENLIVKYGLDGIQILPEEYAYYGLLGKHGVPVGSLEANKPLIISLPNWRYADVRPEWAQVLEECQEKNIDIHIDFAWLTTAKDIDIDLGHPCIKSFCMSLSKYSAEWNRVGLRWSRQRHVDSITMFNHYHGVPNNNVVSCGAFLMQHIPRDYGWDTYAKQHYNVCKQFGLEATNIIHVGINPATKYPLGIGDFLGGVAPD
jgi:hypothetical protein